MRAGAWLRAQWRDGAAISVLMLVVALVVKRVYSTAGADALGWVLVPSCWLARWLDVVAFDGNDLALDLAPESGAGFISHAAHMIVGASCAGVNFLVVAWLALYFCAQSRCVGLRRKLAWLFACGLSAYLATIAINGLRIALAARLYQADIYCGLLTKARLHLALGVALYCAALLAGCGAVERRVAATPTRGPRLARCAPLLWYVVIVLVVPLADGAFLRDPRRFAEHAALTLAAAAAIAGIAWLGGTLLDRLHSGRARS
jgi:exosortase K